MADRVGLQLGNYRLIRLLGQGGFAEVYLAEHLRLKTHAAIKVLYEQMSSQDIQNFTKEAQIVATLRHPHIISLFDFDVQNGLPFLIMDYASNGSLAEKHPLSTLVPFPVVLSYVKQIGDALQFAHTQRFIHRDMKPENILVGRHNELLLSDFGIATITQNSTSIRTQTIVGTTPYMAPEQILGKPCPASDQYALGIIVYTWLCGRQPFTGSVMEIVTQHLSAPPPSLRTYNPAISPHVEFVILKALAKEPQQRFATVNDFVVALGHAHEDTIQGTPAPTYNPHLFTTVVPSSPSSTAYENLRKSVEQESRAGTRGRIHGNIIACMAQAQGDKTVVNLIQEDRWINNQLYFAKVAYAKNHPVDNQVIKAAIFREVYPPGDYMVWINPDNPTSIYIKGGQTLLVVL